MGGKNSIRKNFNSWRHSRKRGNSRLKRSAFCPICNLEFKSWQTYDDFNYHIDNCLIGNDSISPPDHFAHYISPEDKIPWTREQFNTIRVPWSEDHKKIYVSRESVLLDSLKEVQSLDSRDMRSEFQIQFIGEIAMDAGGVMKEWVNILIKQLFAEEMQLFVLTKTQQVSYIIAQNPHQPELYYFAGRLLAKAVFENIPVDCPLCKTVYKHLLDLPTGVEDVKEQDSELFNSLMMIANTRIDDMFIGYFALEKGDMVCELKENGSDICITEENKAEYIHLRSIFETFLNMNPGLQDFKSGFYSVIPQKMISRLSPEDLELILCGQSELDIEEWQAWTEYKGDYSSNHKIIKWFWSVLQEFSQEELSQLLVFVTGTSRVPVEGFSKLQTLRGDPAKFTIQSIEYYKKALPRAHTCFNRLDLPLFTSKSEMKKALKFVINHHSTGFGLE